MRTQRIALLLSVFAFVACGETLEELPPAPLVETADASSDVCPNGGVVIRTGLDDNDDGVLQDSEVDATEPVCSGGMGNPGEDGDDGRASLLDQTEEPPGDNCEFGGSRVDAGFDDDGDGMLDAEEVDATTYVCNGAPGDDAAALLTETSTDTADQCGGNGGSVVRSGLDADGDGELAEEEISVERFVCNGDDGERTLIVVDSEAPGSNCTAGGQRIRSGIDGNADGLLQDNEVTEEDFVCDLVSTLTEVAELAVGSSTVCPSGGQRIDVGVDSNGNGTLEGTEVNQTTYACTGADALEILVSESFISPGLDCAQGGRRLAWGPDEDEDGILDPVEEQFVSFICDGENGADGVDGSAVRLSNEPPGPNCLRGGTRVETGPDLDGDGQLDDGEVRQTSFTCDGAARSSLVDVSPEPAGPNCRDGGQRVDVGIDDDGNGVLDASEIDSTSFVCSTLATVPIDISTNSLPPAVPGQAYGASVDGVGGLGGGYQWSIVSGALPTGLTLDPAGTPSAQISGTAMLPGLFTFTVRLEDFFGNTATKQLSIDVAVPLAIDTFNLPPLTNGVSYSATLSATGGSQPYTWSIASGSLPAGLSLSAGGVISGTPTTDYGSRFIVEAEDGSGNTRRAAYIIGGERRWIAYCGDFVTSAQDDLSLIELSPSGTVTSTGSIVTPIEAATGSATDLICTDFAFSPTRDQIAVVSTGANANDVYIIDFSNFPSVTFVQVTALGSGLDIFDVQWSPDGDRLAYRGDGDTDGVNELYVAEVSDLGNITSRKVNGPVTSGGDIDAFAWTSDSGGIVYFGDEITDQEDELFFVDVDGGGSGVRINSALAAGDVATTWEISPDGQYVLYHAEQDASGDDELYVADISGAQPGLPQKVNGTLVSGGDVGSLADDYGFSPNGRFVFYIADQDVDTLDSLYVWEVGSTNAAVRVSRSTTDVNLDVFDAQWDNTGRRLLYRGDDITNLENELFLVDTTNLGGQSVRVNEPLSTSFSADVETGYAISPDGSFIVYEADNRVSADEEPYFIELSNLGGTATPLLGSSGIASDSVLEIGISESGASIFAVVDTSASTTVTVYEAFAWQVSSGVPSSTLQVNSLFSGTSQDVNSGEVFFTQGGEGILYSSDENVASEDEGFHIPFSGMGLGTRVRLNPTLPSSGDVFEVYAQEL